MRSLRFVAAGLFEFLLSSHPATAQTSSEVGVWKLNLAKSKFHNLEMPKGETRTVQQDGSVIKVHQTGVASDAAR